MPPSRSSWHLLQVPLLAPNVLANCTDADSIQLWICDQLATGPIYDGLVAWLSELEREQANRYLLAEVRQRFVTGRGLLRRLLALNLNCHPSEVPLSVAPRGKPQLVDESIQFNLSHSGNFIAIALSLVRPVGVDVELIQSGFRWEHVSRNFLSPTENEAIMNASSEQRSRLFYRFWTRKEALLKGMGVGLVEDNSVLQAADQWQVESLESVPTAALAVAGLGQGWRLEQRQLDVTTILTLG